MEPTERDVKMMMFTPQPRIAVFSGSSGRDSEDTYDLWKYEVSCLQSNDNYSEATILEAIRRSLRGEAARVAMRLGPGVSLRQLMTKFDSIYGNVQLQ